MSIVSKLNLNLNLNLKDYIKESLALCPEGSRQKFRMMYSNPVKDNDRDINDIVDELPDSKLEWAAQQVERTLIKNKMKKENEKCQNKSIQE